MRDTPFTRLYRGYALGTLTLVFTLNYIDRGLIALLLQPIKEDLHLTDTQLGFLTGIAFGLFYAVLGLPIARLADRRDRSTITAVAIGLWGCAVMLCFWVTSFTQLVAARVAAAIGESGCMPPTYSLLGDYFPKPAQRTRAMAIYWLASPLAALISFIIGGRVNGLYGWRAPFVIMGLPAVIVAVLVKLTLVEPRYRSADLERRQGQPFPRMMEVLLTLWQQRSTRHLSIGIIILLTMGLGLAPWYAAFMIRSHDFDTTQLGVWMGLIFGLGGIAGIAFGGYACARWLTDDERRQTRLSSLMIGLLLPCYVLFLLLPGKTAALLGLIPLVVLFNFFLGPTFALLQRLVSAQMRATTLAVVMLLANLVGMGIGPQVVGILSDRLAPAFGRDSLRYAMLAMSFLALWAAYHFWSAGRTVSSDLSAVRDGPEKASAATMLGAGSSPS